MPRELGILPLSSIAIFALTGCISLTQYYARVPPTAPIGIDPIGGYALFFWVDPDGNVCHGAPGSSGQPGPAAVEAAKPAAIQDAKTNAVVVSTQLLVYQLIPYSLSEYLSSGASGYHLFQFDNVLWRDRTSGEALRDLAKHYYAVPQTVDIGSLPMTLKPQLAWGTTDLRSCRIHRDSGCGTRVVGAAPDAVPHQGVSLVRRRRGGTAARELREAAARRNALSPLLSGRFLGCRVCRTMGH